MVHSLNILTPRRIRELSKEDFEKILKRATIDITRIENRVREIIEDVKRRGDEAIIEFYEKFYGRKVLSKESIKVSKDEINEAYNKVSEEFIEAIKVSAKNIEKFHRSQLPRDLWFLEISPGILVGQIWRPIDSVGIYVPGGRAAYPSTVLMTVIPAKVARVPQITICTPPNPEGKINPYTLVALDIAGARDIYKVGGAHAIAAMAYGTKTIPRVRKVIGPGGIWTTAAKIILRDIIDIEFIAGPTEIVILADESANPKYIARDLISQAEHDPNSSAILVTTSKEKAHEVSRLVNEIIKNCARREIVIQSLKNYGAILIANDLDEAIDFVNNYAPEHLELIIKEELILQTLNKIHNAGSIFIGNYTAVALGDYVLGTNHVLPTSMWAKRRGGLSILDFIKIIDIQYVNERGLYIVGKYGIIMAEAEGLINHAEAIKVRLENFES
mgnify:CR=1 FL=1